jgi:hypothetical protein
MDSLPYYLMLFSIAVPAMVTHVKKPLVGWVLFYLVLLLFVGFRYQVGADWGGYLYLAERVEDSSVEEIIGFGDPLFYFLLWASMKLGFDVYGANLVTSAIFLAGVFAYSRRMTNPWLALYSAIPFLVIVVGMSANRQAAAIGVTLYLLARWDKVGVWRRVMLVAVAAGFHASAIIFFALFLVDSKMSPVRKIAAMTFVLAAAAYFAASSPSVDRYTSTYITDPDAVVSAGALQQILLNALPGLLLLIKRKEFSRYIPQPNFVLAMAVLVLVLVPVSLIYSLAAARISFYLFPVSIAVLSTAPAVSRDSGTRNLVRYLVVLYGAALLGAWLMFANHSSYHLPYGNLLFL